MKTTNYFEHLNSNISQRISVSLQQMVSYNNLMSRVIESWLFPLQTGIKDAVENVYVRNHFLLYVKRNGTFHEPNVYL